MLTNRQLFLQHVAQTSPSPILLEIERAEGMYLHAADGKKYLDMISGIAVSNVGHSHPRVVKAVSEQAQRYMHLLVYGELVESPQVKFAKALCEFLPSSLHNLYFTNSGAEATEGAMKLAKRYTGRFEFVSFLKSYHGSTQGALSLMGDEYFKQNYRPLLPGTKQIRYGIPEDLEQITTHTAAVFFEPIQAESGVTVPTAEYVKQLRQRCTDVGALLVFDEAQTAFGRTGKMFAFEHYGVVPDVLLLAKALGGGMPLGAFISSKKIMQTLTEKPVLGHITTFGGHPVSCAAGFAALCVLQEENLIIETEQKGKFLEELLTPCGVPISRKGLMMSLHFGSFEENKKVMDECLQNGLLTDWFLFAPEYLRLAPPLVISEPEIKWAADIITKAINKCASI